jgi:hypothetical protein
VEDEFDSPFSHVPASGAGPGPLQDGPFTYERLVRSTGRANLSGAPLGRSIALGAAIGVTVGAMLAGVVALVIAIALRG